MIISLLLATSLHAEASSHREAPAIALDPSADITDFYAFVSPTDSTKVVFVMNVNPFENPGGGPNFHRFDDDVRYEINIDNEGDGHEDIVFRFAFETSYAMPDTFLYNTGSIGATQNLNHMQSMKVTRIVDGVSRVLGDGWEVAPPNVGDDSAGNGLYRPKSTTPGGITTSHTYSSTVGGTTYRVFAGPRQEEFFIDLERTFDLLSLNDAGANVNTLLGYNVHTIAVEVPRKALTRDGQNPSVARQNDVIAAWATTSRQAKTTLNGDGTSTPSGSYIQVARLGNPLVNEVVLPVSEKDLFNASHPSLDGQFLSWVTDPLLITYMNALLGVPIPSDQDCDKGLGIGGREDLVEAFLIGLPGATRPGGFALGGPIPGEVGKSFAAFEALRLNLDAATGWPNGRNITDDVVDTALSAEAGILCTGGGTTVTDGVDMTGLYVLDTFPFMGDPWKGDGHPAMLSR